MHKNRKPIFGVGINDHPQSVWVNGKVMKEYQIWTDVLRRCYSEFELNRHPKYRGCEASDGFKRFSGFLSWVRLLGSLRMNTITLFNGTKSQTTFNLLTDLVLVDVDEQDDDLLAVLDLGGITLEYISTNKGLELDDAYIMDGVYCHIALAEFNNTSLKNYVESLIMAGLK